MTKIEFAIFTKNVIKSYENLEVLKGVDLSVPTGSIFGLLGPNGSGKTTLLEIIEGIRRPDGGKVLICNFDPFEYPKEIKHLVGAQLQDTKLNSLNSVGEILQLFSSFYSKDTNWKRVAETVKLTDHIKKLYKDLSGGQKQLLAIGLALLGNPDVLILDEPTVGLDVNARDQIYQVIKNVKSAGKTILLTTHYLEEAEVLCDFVAILDKGEIIATGNPKSLCKSHLANDDNIIFSLSSFIAPDDISRSLNGLKIRYANGKYTTIASDIGAFSKDLSHYSTLTNNPILSINIIENKLEDVFKKLTEI